MWKPTFDPGLTQQYTGSLRRMINKDGSFNVVRRGAGWRDIHPYLHLINASWTMFFTVIISAYAVVNMMFATVYYLLGPDTLSGGFEAPTATGRFLTSLYFSFHTLGADWLQRTGHHRTLSWGLKPSVPRGESTPQHPARTGGDGAAERRESACRRRSGSHLHGSPARTREGVFLSVDLDGGASHRTRQSAVRQKRRRSGSNAG